MGGIRDGVLEDEADEGWLKVNTTMECSSA